MGSNYGFAADGRVDFFQYDPTQYNPYGNTSMGTGYDGSGINPYTNGTLDPYMMGGMSDGGYGPMLPPDGGGYAPGNVWSESYDPYGGAIATLEPVNSSPSTANPYSTNPYGGYSPTTNNTYTRPQTPLSATMNGYTAPQQQPNMSYPSYNSYNTCCMPPPPSCCMPTYNSMPPCNPPSPITTPYYGSCGTSYASPMMGYGRGY